MKPTPPEVTAPGFTTVTVAMPAEAIRAAETEAVSCVALTKVVASAVPFHCTTAPEMKPVPFTVSVNAAALGAADAGPRLEIAGADGDAGVTWKLWKTDGASA